MSSAQAERREREKEYKTHGDHDRLRAFYSSVDFKMSSAQETVEYQHHYWIVFTKFKRKRKKYRKCILTEKFYTRFELDSLRNLLVEIDSSVSGRHINLVAIITALGSGIVLIGLLTTAAICSTQRRVRGLYCTFHNLLACTIETEKVKLYGLTE